MIYRLKVARTACAWALLVVAMPTLAQAPMIYKDPSAPIAARVQDLLGRMTLEEKSAQMRSMWIGKSAILDNTGAFSPEKALKSISDGIGQIARPSDMMGTSSFRISAGRSLED